MRSFLIYLILFLNLAGLAWAESPLAERRAVVFRDTDFPGGDIQSVFDTSRSACETACETRADCTAYTFNTLSSACFLKSEPGAPAPFTGALSAQITPRSAEALARAEAQVARLGFLTGGDLSDATLRARKLPYDFPVGGWSADELRGLAREAEGEANLAAALRYMAGATTLSDTPGDWIDLARLSNAAALATEDTGAARKLFVQARDAAVVGFWLSASGPQEANALVELATALEQTERGPAAVPALRLAQELSPRDDIAAALQRVRGLYGFRVTETSVDSDAAAPRLCATFSEDLAGAGVDYAPYVGSDMTGLAVTAKGTQLCLEGLSHGARVSVTLRPGLPAASGEELAQPVELTQYIRDRTPRVRFPGRAYVLAPTADAGLPLVSVNAPEVVLKLKRLPEGNLVRAFGEDWFGRSLTIWDEEWFSEALAEPVWEGKATLATELNRDVTTRLPIGEALDAAQPGVYVLTASVPAISQDDSPPASQWFIVSDIGLSTFQGTDGLHVFARALTSAAPLAGARLELRSRANGVLGQVTTDAEGYALFAPGMTTGTGSAAPALVTAAQGDDFAFLSLTGPAFDLSDRGVEGHPAAPPIDLFLTTDRGAYRAGEVIHATALARDAGAEAIDGLPITAVLTRPDGVEYARNLSQGAGAGGHVFALPLAAGAPRGTWRLDLHADPGAPALASTTLLVEDFLPERIDVALALSDPRPRLTDTPRLTVDATYLFGAPGAELAVDGDLRLAAVDRLEDWPGYRFGPHEDRLRPTWATLDSARTDATGQAVLPVTFPEVSAEGTPLEARFTLRVKEGSGRPVERALTVPVTPEGPLIGIKPGFDARLPEGAEARFELIALGPDLQPMPMQVTWALNRVTTRYQWYASHGNWAWEPTTTRERVASGSATLGKAPVTVAAPTDWGRYELVVTETQHGSVSASVGFSSGWYAPADAAASPDMLEVSLDATRYSPGDTATLRFVPRAPGKVLVTVLSNRLIDRVAVDAVAGENTLALPVTDAWGAGAYVSATLIRPLDGAEGREPTRALGLAHASVDPGVHALTARLDVPAEARPREPLEVVLDVEGLAEGETAYATLAAVDVGILNLTSFQSPDPSDHYFGQRRLGMALRDLYGRLIDGQSGVMGQIRSGGDAMAEMRMQAAPPTEALMAQFSGPLTVSNGQIRATFDLPEFNGTLRLMAVVWSQTGVGEASADVLVRDPVVVTATLPRFLAPGDEGRLRVEMTHATGPAGAVSLTATPSSAALSLVGITQTLTLGENQTQSVTMPLTATAEGHHSIDLVLTTPDGTALTKRLTLPVHRLDPQVAQTSRFTLAAGESLSLTRDLFAGLTGARATVTAGPLARVDAAGLIQRLDTYPYGCTEQQASRALPLLYLSGFAEAMGLADRDDLPGRVQEAIAAVLANQESTGSFGLWRPATGDLWLDAYATDFLARARGQGYAVPDTGFRAAMDNLRNKVSYYPDFEAGGEDLAYALYVLAREGGAAMGDLRYYADVKAGALATPLAAAQLGAALAAYGDPTRADALFAQAGAQIATAPAEGSGWRDDYGTQLRDTAGVLALAVEAGSMAVDREALLDRLAGAPAQLSTQEAAWMLLAAHGLLVEAPGAGLTLDGTALTGPVVEVLSETGLVTPKVIANTGAGETLLTVTAFGVPDASPPASGNGYAIERRYFTLDGAPADPARVAHGDRLVTLLTVTPWEQQEGRLMVVDPLPAGFEIDNPNLLRAGDMAALDWLQVTAETERVEFRQDRFLAAVDWTSDKPLRLAYVVRAVTPGRFHHPAASVEDMYRPMMRAVGASGEVLVGD